MNRFPSCKTATTRNTSASLIENCNNEGYRRFPHCKTATPTHFMLRPPPSQNVHTKPDGRSCNTSTLNTASVKVVVEPHHCGGSMYGGAIAPPPLALKGSSHHALRCCRAPRAASGCRRGCGCRRSTWIGPRLSCGCQGSICVVRRKTCPGKPLVSVMLQVLAPQNSTCNWRSR